MDFSRRRRRWLLFLATAGVSGYGAYRAYNHPAVSKKRRQLAALLRALISVSEAASSAADVVALVSRDLNLFLRSDSDEIPTSLKQLAKITSSDQFSDSVSRVSQALTVGVVRGFNSASPGEKAVSKGGSFSDRIIDKLLSDRGSGFVSVVVGSFARNLVLTFFYSRDSGKEGSDSDSDSVPGWLRLMCSDEGRVLTADCIQKFVRTAMEVYLEKTMEVNTYDELFSGLTNPKHEAKVKDMLVSVCNGAVETLVKTSHRVMNEAGSSSSVNRVKECNKEDHMQDRHNQTDNDYKFDGGGGWVDRVSSTLAVPSNRRLLLDVTGRVTTETVRSLLDFILWKLYDGARKSVNVIRSEVVERGLEVVRYFRVKSMAIFTICFTLCIHLMTRTRFLMMA